MAEIVTMPKLGFDMAEGTLVRWVVAEGEQVNKGGVLAEIDGQQEIGLVTVSMLEALGASERVVGSMPLMLETKRVGRAGA